MPRGRNRTKSVRRTDPPRARGAATAEGSGPAKRRPARASYADDPPASKPPETPHPAERAEKPRRKDAEFPIAVIGASAGGLDAFKKLLAAMPSDCGLALVLVPHLDPRHESLMVELLSRQTALTVQEAKHGAVVRPNHVYIIPPNKYLAVERGKLALSPPPKARAGQPSIDFALCSLARDQEDAAIGVILSGTGNHGVEGIKEIKLWGGVVLVQDPATAEFDQMPRSALRTGIVDYTLAPERMPEVLLQYVRRWQSNRARANEAPDTAADGLRRVLALLQARTKHDFRHYRKNMIVRRVERRMALQQMGTWDTYLSQLRDNPDEVVALFRDLLIGVTSFFRDAEAFIVLAEQALPKLVARADSDAPVRVWVPGCASGEEAYSIAILLIEAFKATDRPASLQVFATDVDERSLETARQGVYPDSIATALSPERLKHFFVRVDAEHYQVSKQLRDTVVFAPQNLISDAPFSKLDLISCRNVLIYLEPEVQEKIITLLHFALNDGGYLLLGPSESIGRVPGMFEPISKKWRLYRRVGPVRRDLVTIPIAAADGRRTAAAAAERARRGPAGFTQLMQKLLAEDFAPASALINRDYEILSVQGPLVNYLEFPAGEMTKDLLTLARQGLRIRIRSACQQAAQEGRTITEEAARVRRNGDYVPCTITVRPIMEPKDAHGLLLVVFRDRAAPPAPEPPAAPLRIEESSVVDQLEQELRATREDLQSTIEELESSNEELKASNEEIMSMNEELQSTNEELETSKEELQSLNEELATVNSQLQEKVDELDGTNNDLTNLMAATGIATVFLDDQLRIKRFTPPTARLLNLVTSDVGRWFRDFAPRFKDDTLVADAEQVLKTLGLAEKEVRAEDDRWYMRRILPYRSSDNRIEGVVITFFDITKRITAEAQARRFASALIESNDAVTVSDLDGRISAWNEGAEQLLGYAESEALAMNIRELVPDPLQLQMAELLARAARGEGLSVETQRKTKTGVVIDVWLTLTPLKDEKGAVVGVASVERDITMRRRSEETVRSLNAALERRVAERTAALEVSEQRVRAVLDAAVDAIIAIDARGTIETFNAAAEKMFGYSADEVISQNVSVLMPSPHREEHDEYVRRYRETGRPHVIGRTRDFKARRKDGSEFPVRLSVGEIGNRSAFVGIIRDTTDELRLQDEVVRIATLEQRRIGEELHDNTQQELTGLGLLAEDLQDRLPAESAARALAAKLAARIAEANRRVRELARGLVPVPITGDGLMVALDELAQTTKNAAGVECRFDCPTPVTVREDMVAHHVYRIAQEAVTNAVKHAAPRSIEIRLTADERNLELAVSDDGTGIGGDARGSEGVGLRIMEHRCSLIGGTFSIQPGDMRGTVVTCSVPRARVL